VLDTIDLDKEPFCVAVNEETNRVYIGVDRGIIVLNGETDEVMEEIPFKIDPVIEESMGDYELYTLNIFAIDILAVNPETNRIFASWGAGSQVSVFNGFTNKEVNQIPCVGAEYASPEEPYCFALNPTTNLVYIADRTTYKGRYDRVLVYDAKTGEFVASVNIPGSNEIEYSQYVGVAVNPVTNRIYVTYSVINTLYVLDGDTNKIIGSRENCFHLAIGDHMVDTMINPKTNRIYFVASELYRDSVFNGETLESVNGSYSGCLRAVDTQRDILYTTGLGELYAIDGNTHETLASLELGWSVNMNELAVNSKTGKLYLLNRSNNEISVIQRTLTEKPEEPEESGVLLNWFLLNWYILVIVFAVVGSLVALSITLSRAKKQVQVKKEETL
jgi:DNA-binding beta-propeller fold protein YncE